MFVLIRIFLLAYLTSFLCSCASSPKWYSTKPQSYGDYEYASGMGVSSNPEEALKKARDDALENSKLANKERSESSHNEPILCKDYRKSNGEYTYYVLLMVYSHYINPGGQTEKIINCDSYSNDYLSVAIGNGVINGDIGGANVLWRHNIDDDGMFGFGLIGGIGWSNKEAHDILHYSGGIKLYPYYYAFLATIFGTLDSKYYPAENNGSGFRNAHRKTLHGFSILGGFDFNYRRLNFEISGGVSKIFQENWLTPAYNISIGYILF